MRTRGERNGWFVLAVSLVLFATSGYIAADNILFLIRAERVQGEVVSNREERSNGKLGEIVRYYPLVQFADQAGMARRVEVSQGLLQLVMVDSWNGADQVRQECVEVHMANAESWLLRGRIDGKVDRPQLAAFDPGAANPMGACGIACKKR
jgi:hypothetical protein